jgi:hypothetical protein
MSALACYHQLEQEGQLSKMQTPRKLSSPARGNFSIFAEALANPEFYSRVPRWPWNLLLHRSCTSVRLEEPAPIALAVIDVTHLLATSCEPLLISQGHNGVRLGRAPCWNVAGEQRDSGQDQRDDDERQRVGGFDAVEQVGQEAGQS